MSTVFHRLLFTLAGASDNELRRQIQFLKAENEILRSRLKKQIRLKPWERARLLRLGIPLGRAIRDLITIVKPKTFARWVREQSPSPIKRKARRPGRPRTPEEIRELVVRVARETGWGYTRILGELKKLGISKICRSTVVNILREHGLDPGPKRGEGTWDEFVRMHAKTLWACDFMPKKIVTARGLIDAFVIVFINVQSRRAYVSPCTPHPSAEWVEEQARVFCRHVRDDANRPTIMLRDRDTKFCRRFDAAIRSGGIRVKRLPPQSPNLNAYAERFVQTLEQECLDHFIVLGQRHLDYLVREYLVHYNRERPHQAVGNVPLAALGPPGEPFDPHSQIACRERLGGLLKHYVRQAA